MRVPLSWLRDFAPLDQPVDTIVATLDDLGLAVESIERVGEGLDGVVVAKAIRNNAEQWRQAELSEVERGVQQRERGG